MQRIDCLARLSELLFLSRTLSSRYCLREEKASAPVAAGGAGGLPRLRWPSGLCEVVETAVLPRSVVVVLVVLGLGFRRRRQRRHGIRSSRALLLASLVLHSGAGGEPVEVVLPAWSSCTGVVRRRFIDPEGW